MAIQDVNSSAAFFSGNATFSDSDYLNTLGQIGLPVTSMLTGLAQSNATPPTYSGQQWSENPSGSTYRGLLSDIFNAENIAKEDWIRGEQSADMAHQRSLDMLDRQNAFNAGEAEKQRAWEKEMADSSYTRAVEDMKRAGLNPILALQNGGAPTGSGSTASAGSGSSHKSNYGGANSPSTANIVGTVIGTALKAWLGGKYN